MPSNIARHEPEEGDHAAHFRSNNWYQYKNVNSLCKKPRTSCKFVYHVDRSAPLCK